MRKLLLLTLSLLPFFLFSQTDTLLQNLNEEDLIENFIQNQEEEADFDFNDLFDKLRHYQRRPLNLNNASKLDLDDFFFLSELQKTAFLEYRKQTGDLLEIYELQAVPGFDLETIRQLLPFVTTRNFSLFDMDLQQDNKNQIIMRWSRNLQMQKGYNVPTEDTSASRYLGDPNRLYLRYRYTKPNRLYFGATMEKDAGEEFFKGSNKQGFDYYSAHLFIQDPNGRLKTVALGDFSVNFGQGLLIWQGFGAGKNALATVVKRSGRTLRPYASVNEIDFFRGAAATYGLAKNLDLTAFGSFRKKDGNQGEPEELPDDPDARFITSLQTSGFHRTATEIADKNSVKMTTAGASLKYAKNLLQVGLNTIYNHLDQPLQLNPQLYNQYYFQGSSIYNVSVDYAYSFRNYHLFGETAIDPQGTPATLNGLLIGFDRGLEMAIMHRSYPRNFQALQAQPFAETSGARNETGTYFGLSFKPNRAWQFSGYFDLWQHPWLRFGVDAPSRGHEWLLRAAYSRRYKFDAYVQIRQEVKEVNATAETITDQLTERNNLQARLHLAYKLTRSIEWRSRFDAGFSKKEGETLKGVSLYQDLIYRQKNSPFSFNLRYAIFDTDDFAIRFYSYESDLMNSFSVPAYYNRGTRFYFNCRYKVTRSFLVEARFERTFYANLDVIGSGLEEINGSVKSGVRAQAVLNF